jgi:hypothetical protein
VHAGHVGKDDRSYLLDLARTFPPEAPSETPHLPVATQSIFYRLLRPGNHITSPGKLSVFTFLHLCAEFLAYLRANKLCSALSSDAFASFGAHNAATHNQHVQDATRILVQTVLYNPLS